MYQILLIRPFFCSFSFTFTWLKFSLPCFHICWSIQHLQQLSTVPKGTGKRGHIVADTLLLMMFLGRANARDTKWMLCFHATQTGKHLLRTKNVPEQNQKHFLCPGHIICVRNKCCARGQTGKHLCRQQCVRNNVSSFARALTFGVVAF